MHDKGILYNDHNSRNILRNKEYVKIIDFGNATLVSDPLRCEKHKMYNAVHCHIAYELQNV